MLRRSSEYMQHFRDRESPPGTQVQQSELVQHCVEAGDKNVKQYKWLDAVIRLRLPRSYGWPAAADRDNDSRTRSVGMDEKGTN
jgi:hypothetical protein